MAFHRFKPLPALSRRAQSPARLARTRPWRPTNEMKEIPAGILGATPVAEKSADGGLCRSVQGAADDPGIVDDVGRLLPRLARADGLHADAPHPAGTALLAAGASALNQLLEREYDAKMRRTQDRPLPSGRMHAGSGADHRRRVRGGGSDLSGAGGQSAHGAAGRGDAGQLFVCLYAAQARHDSEHRHRRHSRRAAAADGLDGGAGRNRAAKAGRSLPSCSSGNCPISWPSPGFTGTNTRGRDSSCCRWWTRRARARANRP